jgi:hypothetical protein
MASKSPKLPPELPSDAVAAPATRRAHVHIVPADGGWAVRLGRRVEMTLATRHDALMAAIPFARERGSRLFVHYASGEIRESGTAKTDELMLEMWQMIYDQHNPPAN